MTYLATLLPLVSIYAILVLGLNLQFGQTGILNFTYISFVAIGAYTSAVLTLGAPHQGITYILGANVPFPLNLLAAGLAASALGLLVALSALQRLRSDYLAIVTVAAGSVFYTLVGNVTELFNGWQGLDGVPVPVPDGLGQTEQQLFFGGITLVVLVLTFVVVERIRRSPLGRVLRSVREDETVPRAFGRDVAQLKLLSFLLGSFIAGVGGALLASYITAYNPAAFIPADTFLLWAAMFVGGAGNNWGAVLGAVLIPVGMIEVTRFIPNLVPIDPFLVQSIRGIAIGLIVIFVPWLWPRGLVPERLPRDQEKADGSGDRSHVPATLFGPSREVAAADGERRVATGSILTVEEVSKSFGGLRAVSHCSFEVHRGMVTGLIGPNGAGKSTIVNLIAGELKPDSGLIMFDGHSILGLPPHQVSRRGLSRTFQIPRQLDRLTVMESLLLGPYPQQGERVLTALVPTGSANREQADLRARAREVLAVFDLAKQKDQPVGDLSGGQKKLVELARALMAQPRLLLLDEPTAGVNPALLDRLLEHIRSLPQMGVTTLIVEHNLAVIESLCDDVVVMAAGAVLARGRLDELRAIPDVVEAYLGTRRAYGTA